MNAGAHAAVGGGTAERRSIAVLGATGSIGTSALDVIARHPDLLHAGVLAAGSNVDALLALCATHRPRHAVIADESAYATLRDGLRELGLSTQAHAGATALDALVAGELLTSTAREAGAQVVPIDSEHNAIFQCLPDDNARRGLQRLFLTASGGPFRGRTRAQLADVTPAQAVAHPKWNMGPKISVDSATLMNKGLEVIEAHHLFGLPAERIDVLVHPQSLVHSLVEFVDGSTLAQLGLPDMRTALAVGFGWPARIASGVAGLDLLAHGRLDFEPPDFDAFPCLRLAFDALNAGGTAPAMLNAANEIAVSAFLQGRIGFLSIPALVEATLAALPRQPADSLDTLLAADADARRHATQAISRMALSA